MTRTTLNNASKLCYCYSFRTVFNVCPSIILLKKNEMNRIMHLNGWGGAWVHQSVWVCVTKQFGNNFSREKVCNSLVTHVNSFRGGETIFKPVHPSLYLLTHCCRWNRATHTTVDLSIYHETIQNTHEEKKDTVWGVVGWLVAQTRVLKRDRDGTGGKKEGERDSTQGESSSWYEFMRGWIN